VKSSGQLGCTAEPCPEKDLLHKRFEAAESAWSEVSVALIVACIVMNPTPATMRYEALEARNTAASDLYKHRQGLQGL
jgi:hypothetical protein